MRKDLVPDAPLRPEAKTPHPFGLSDWPWTPVEAPLVPWAQPKTATPPGALLLDWSVCVALVVVVDSAYIAKPLVLAVRPMTPTALPLSRRCFDRKPRSRWSCC